MTATEATSLNEIRCDLIISGGTIVDGSGEQPYVGDVGIAGDRIASIGDLRGLSATKRIDATGMVVMPGMIDMHGHSDHSLLMSSSAESKLSQGVTTEVAGNCGMSAAPFRPQNSLLGYTTEAAVAALDGKTWTNMASYIDLLQERRPGINVAPQVGYGTALQLAQMEPGTAAEHSRKALSHVEMALDAGAVGATFGLYYPPERDCDREELVAVAAAVAARDAVLSVHLRDEGNFSVGLDKAVQEMLAVCRPHHTRLELSHLKALGPGGWDRIDSALDAVLQAKDEGLDVGADQYPYEAGELALVDALGLPRDLGMTRAPIDLDRVNYRIAQRGGAERLVVAHCSERQELLGMDLSQAIEFLNVPFLEAIRVLIVEENATVANFAVREADMTRIMRYPWVGVGSDGVAIPKGLFHHLDNPHPRNYGCFTRYLSRYVRDAQIVPLELAVRKACALPAERVRLKDRGYVRTGYFADLAVFDLAAVTDNATYTAPSELSSGISHVLVNGRVALKDGKVTSENAGRVLTAS